MAAKVTKSSDHAENAEMAKIAKYLLPGMSLDKMLDKDALDELRNDWKRAHVVNTDALFDSILKNFLTMYFYKDQDKVVEKLFDPNIGGPLVSLTHKARLAYALGLIGETTLNEYEGIHKIRNEFAHSRDASFADPKVIRHIQKLSSAKGHKVTAKNSYGFYEEAIHVCLDGLAEALRQLHKHFDAKKLFYKK